ncbi:hypothetical protein AB434_3647 [Heyndrickxia coagulans]|jgi:hypothetical protein|nr:hypothetical protein AB434_3647 [Heyndrickxia coagulans]KYC61767.1 hypothetical protein B4100_2906 [Heyndrickxia coagulans]WNE60404.1 hypothetical protein KIY57_10375 [Heyndrickxia coagulans]
MEKAKGFAGRNQPEPHARRLIPACRAAKRRLKAISDVSLFIEPLR